MSLLQLLASSFFFNWIGVSISGLTGKDDSRARSAPDHPMSIPMVTEMALNLWGKEVLLASPVQGPFFTVWMELQLSGLTPFVPATRLCVFPDGHGGKVESLNAIRNMGANQHKYIHRTTRSISRGGVPPIHARNKKYTRKSPNSSSWTLMRLIIIYSEPQIQYTERNQRTKSEILLDHIERNSLSPWG